MRIAQLPPDVITKIAAGEVIERPASVVKELMENALDAGSSRIEVEVEQGGADLVRVVDDGCGIAAADLPLALASHATSKLRSADDLFRVGTLGFRGEALASISGVARVRLQSRAADEETGAEITCQGGDLSAVRPWNGARGSRVEVHHLFYNTPVRRKFLRAAATEMGHICEAFTGIALSRPGLHLTLRHNGKAVYEVPPSAGLLERVGLFFGAEVRDHVYRIDTAEGLMTVRGFIADPACERGNARLQYLFVNGRWIRDRSIGHALQEAYRGLLMSGRYAVAFLFLDLPTDQVDVNVHPTKAEVRFRQGSAPYQLVFRAVRERLRSADLTARLRFTGHVTPSAYPGISGSSALGALLLPKSTDLSRGDWPTAQLNSATPAPSPSFPPIATGSAEAMPSAPPLEPPALKAIQLYDAYLVLETPEGMLVIDQHALHERILFEQLKKRIACGPLESQRLLIPEPIDLPAEQMSRVLDQREALRELGLEIGPFGGNSIVLSSYPALLGHRPPLTILRGVVDHLLSRDRLPSREQLLNDLLSVMACHAAVRAGDRLTQEEIATLVAQRDVADDAHHCPHGRPTSLLLSRHDLDRQFRRV
jgi:DNA mismatch repair protein MutL